METTLCTRGDAPDVSLPGKTEQAAMTPLVARAVARSRAGDPDALRFLYARYADDVYAYARTIGSDHDEAQAVTQRVFAGLERLIDRYEERDDAPFSVWIMRVARGILTEDIHR
jgi:hypothetical protein